MKNKYVLRSRISEAKFRQLARCFALDLDARQAAAITGLNRNTTNRYYRLIRQRIAEFCENESPFSGEIEVDESYFGGKRIKGKRGRGAGGKTPVFGIFQRNGMVYTEVVPDCAKATLQAIIRGRVSLDSVIHSDGWRGYNGLVDLGYKKHFRVQHGQNEFARGRSHINGIESFWSFAKRRLMKFHGVPERTFYLHLKECEFRFNYRGDELYAIILKMN
ncbi:IS1595 family transposase [Oceanidesulfovibrio indonesiensis]|uniref:IS1595 family transposase n=1 Tax=Oceanidesulfovibrio indonesiensis TaxID=54767 RepID=A0A7M3MEF3_9BACT|nr:IS1595 family transposase [Oceanidesulfovibrio indonesiensis]TVM17195.1 IS1595 family transposase [Oceanidesulfovibrio indonesiensis]